MSDAYTPGLLVTRDTDIRRVRRLPAPGRVLVEVGARVEAETIVATAELPGPVSFVNVATGLGLDPAEVAPYVCVAVGATLAQGDVIACKRGWWGWSQTEVKAPEAGVLESISAVTGLAVVRGAPRQLTCNAYVDGIVDEVMPGQGVVVRARGAVVQGIFGLAGERRGRLACVATSAQISKAHAGTVVVVPSQVSHADYQRAVDVGAVALVCAAMAYQDIRAILGYDVGVAVTGNEDLATGLILTEGFGALAMADATQTLLTALEGRMVSVNGTTQIRAGVLRPELLVTEARGALAGETVSPVGTGLVVGARVRGIREPHFGKVGSVIRLPGAPEIMPSGAKLRVVEVRFADGEALVPRANVEVIAQ